MLSIFEMLGVKIKLKSTNNSTNTTKSSKFSYDSTYIFINFAKKIFFYEIAKPCFEYGEFLFPLREFISY